MCFLQHSHIHQRLEGTGFTDRLGMTGFLLNSLGIEGALCMHSFSNTEKLILKKFCSQMSHCLRLRVHMG